MEFESYIDPEVPVLCIITSESCGHCKRMKRPTLEYERIDKGLVDSMPGGSCWSQDTFIRLMFGLGKRDKTAQPEPDTPDQLVDMVVSKAAPKEMLDAMASVSGDDLAKLRSEASKAAMPKYNIVEVNYDGLPRLRIFRWNGTKIQVLEGEHLNSLIPHQIRHYVNFYPSFCIFDAKSWISSAKGSGGLIGKTFGLDTVKEPNGLYSTRKKENGNIDMTEIRKLLNDAFDGNLQVPEPTVKPDTRGTAPGISGSQVVSKGDGDQRRVVEKSVKSTTGIQGLGYRLVPPDS